MFLITKEISLEPLRANQIKTMNSKFIKTTTTTGTMLETTPKKLNENKEKTIEPILTKFQTKLKTRATDRTLTNPKGFK